jgi:hypothetical protein
VAEPLPDPEPDPEALPDVRGVLLDVEGEVSRWLLVAPVPLVEPEEDMAPDDDPEDEPDEVSPTVAEQPTVRASTPAEARANKAF